MSNRIGQDAVRKLYEQHRRGLFAYACSFVPSFATAEDILHQVFERLLRADLEISGSPIPYLYRAIRNTALNQIRDRSREVNLENGWLESPSGMEQTGFELQSVLQELPEEQLAPTRPPQSAPSPDNPGKEIFLRACTSCHAANVTQRQAFTSRDEYANLVSHEVSKGASLSSTEVPVLIEYLFKTLGLPSDLKLQPQPGFK